MSIFFDEKQKTNKFIYHSKAFQVILDVWSIPQLVHVWSLFFIVSKIRTVLDSQPTAFGYLPIELTEKCNLVWNLITVFKSSASQATTVALVIVALSRAFARYFFLSMLWMSWQFQFNVNWWMKFMVDQHTLAEKEWCARRCWINFEPTTSLLHPNCEAHSIILPMGFTSGGEHMWDWWIERKQHEKARISCTNSCGYFVCLDWIGLDFRFKLLRF